MKEADKQSAECIANVILRPKTDPCEKKQNKTKAGFDRNQACWFFYFFRIVELLLNYSGKMGNKKRTLQARKVRKYAGAPEGTRTPDLLVRSQSLYPSWATGAFNSNIISYASTLVNKLIEFLHLFYRMFTSFLVASHLLSTFKCHCFSHFLSIKCL